MGGLLERPQPWPRRQGGAPRLRRMLLCERQEQLRDAELQCVRLLLMRGGLVQPPPSGISVHVSVQMYTDVQPSREEAAQAGIPSRLVAELRLHSRPQVLG